MLYKVVLIFEMKATKQYFCMVLLAVSIFIAICCFRFSRFNLNLGCAFGSISCEQLSTVGETVLFQVEKSLSLYLASTIVFLSLVCYTNARLAVQA